jgi:hypothetical protein
VLRRIFGPKRKEVTGGWRRLHNEEFHNLYTSLNVIKVIKWENLKERDHAEDLGINGKIVLECILGKYGGGFGLDSPASGQRPLAGSYEHGNDPSGSIKDEESVD